MGLTQAYVTIREQIVTNVELEIIKQGPPLEFTLGFDDVNALFDQSNSAVTPSDEMQPQVVIDDQQQQQAPQQQHALLVPDANDKQPIVVMDQQPSIENVEQQPPVNNITSNTPPPEQPTAPIAVQHDTQESVPERFTDTAEPTTTTNVEQEHVPERFTDSNTPQQ